MPTTKAWAVVIPAALPAAALRSTDARIAVGFEFRDSARLIPLETSTNPIGFTQRFSLSAGCATLGP